MKISKVRIPETSLLYVHGANYDYVDSYEGQFKEGLQQLGSDEVGILFFKSGPKWIEKLFDLRNKLVSIFGLKTPGKSGTQKNIPEHFKCEIGDQLGLFKVFDKTENEIILGEDDKHLDFRVSLMIGQNDKYKDKKT